MIIRLVSPTPWIPSKRGAVCVAIMSFVLMTVMTVWVLVDPRLTAIAPLWFYLAFWPGMAFAVVFQFRGSKGDRLEKPMLLLASAMVISQGVALLWHHHH